MAATAILSTVDLSRLPAPALVEDLSYEAILDAMLADLVARMPAFSALTDSDPAMIVLQVAAYRELLLRQRVNDVGRQTLVAYAGNSNLDHLAALVGVPRLAGEKDEALRRRIVLAPFGFSTAGPTSAYVYHALSASGLVQDASATSPAPGEVLVSILSTEGHGQASDALVAIVNAALSAETVRPMTDKVTVRSAQIVGYQVDALLYLYQGPDGGVVRAKAAANLAAYIAAGRKLGRDATMSGLYAALHVEGVQRVELRSPTGPIIVDPTQAAICTASFITVAGVDD